jgi:8-oxo-dGTP pyrophosphatase MutT (NUDIX family)
MGFRVAFRVAHRMLRAYWRVRKPRTRGALVALWHADELLIVKNSYRREYTLPGGYIRRSENALQAAARELAEEVGVQVSESRLREAYQGTHAFEDRDDEVTIVELQLDDRPQFAVDRREVVWAGFKSAEEIEKLPIVPHLRDYLDQTIATRSS